MLKFEKLGTILTPADEYHAKFNCGAYFDGEKVHLLYRWAKIPQVSGGAHPKYEENYISYACMSPEGKLICDADKPFMQITHEFESRGLEDPRIVMLDGSVYITYTAYDGKQARVGIAVTDKTFSRADKMGIVPACKFDKDAYFFPERIDGKIAYVHRFEPNIQIDYFTGFDRLLSKEFWSDYNPDLGSVAVRAQNDWECGKVGGSAPPIKTDKGWLMIYHAVAFDRKPFCYRAGLLLLDLNDPKKIISRIPYPVMEPTESYEIQGDVNNVVFPCGNYVYDGYYYIVYGGADKVTALARCKLDDIMAEFGKYLD